MLCNCASAHLRIRAPVQVGVSNLSARGTVRIAIKPLLDELPVAGGVKVGGDVWPWWPHTMVATHHSVVGWRGRRAAAACTCRVRGCCLAAPSVVLAVQWLQISFLGAPEFRYDMRLVARCCP